MREKGEGGGDNEISPVKNYLQKAPLIARRTRI